MTYLTSGSRDLLRLPNSVGHSYLVQGKLGNPLSAVEILHGKDENLIIFPFSILQKWLLLIVVPINTGCLVRTLT